MSEQPKLININVQLQAVNKQDLIGMCKSLMQHLDNTADDDEKLTSGNPTQVVSPNRKKLNQFMAGNSKVQGGNNIIIVEGDQRFADVQYKSCGEVMSATIGITEYDTSEVAQLLFSLIQEPLKKFYINNIPFILENYSRPANDENPFKIGTFKLLSEAENIARNQVPDKTKVDWDNPEEILNADNFKNQSEPVARDIATVVPAPVKEDHECIVGYAPEVWAGNNGPLFRVSEVDQLLGLLQDNDAKGSVKPFMYCPVCSKPVDWNKYSQGSDVKQEALVNEK